MNVTVHRWSAVLLAGAVALGVSVSAAQAQPVMRPSLINPAFTVAPGIQQYNNLVNTAILGRTLRQIPPYAFGFNPYPQPIVGGMSYIPPIYPTLGSYAGMGGAYPSSATLTTNPYGGAGSLTSSYGGYGGSGYGSNTYGSMDPNYGFLSGTANVIDASGNYLKSVQDARLKQTTADEARIDYRRRLIDEARYERGLLPTTEELRQQELTRNLDWYRHQPPISDIASARALNAILNHLTSDPSVGKGPNVPIDEEVLKRINVTSPTAPTASLGLLKDDGKLQWPAALSGKEFEGPRNDLTERLQTVVAALKFSNKPEAGAIVDLNGDLAKLRSAGQNVGPVSDRIHRCVQLSRSGERRYPGLGRPERRRQLQPQVQREERGGADRRHERVWTSPPRPRAMNGPTACCIRRWWPTTTAPRARRRRPRRSRSSRDPGRAPIEIRSPAGETPRGFCIDSRSARP